MDIAGLVEHLYEEAAPRRIAMNRLAQFGQGRRQYLGATLLPERPVDSNEFSEDNIRYKTVIANDGDRYSPSQRKRGGFIWGSMSVSLGHQDIANEFVAQDYERLLKLLERNASMDAVVALTNWLDITINRGLIEKEEVQRWQAIIDRRVVRVGHNGFHQTVLYPDPVGHRALETESWVDPEYDPYESILAQASVLIRKGYTISRMIGSKRIQSLALQNRNIARRLGRVTVFNNGDAVREFSQPVTIQDLNNRLNADGLPDMETYDLTYMTQTASYRFMPDDVLVFIAETGRDEEIAVEEMDEMLVVPNTLGYTALGIPVGHPTSGRIIRMEAKEDKPPRIDAEGWQSTLPVIADPEAIATLGNING